MHCIDSPSVSVVGSPSNHHLITSNHHPITVKLPSKPAEAPDMPSASLHLAATEKTCRPRCASCRSVSPPLPPRIEHALAIKPGETHGAGRLGGCRAGR